MARPDTQPGVEGGEEADGQSPTPSPGVPTDAAVPPGTGVVRPGTGVVRPGTGVVGPAESAAKARAVVPEAPEQPREPIHVVLPVIQVRPAKQGFLDRLVAPKPKKAKKKSRDEAETGPDQEIPVSPAVSPPPAPQSPAPPPPAAPPPAAPPPAAPPAAAPHPPQPPPAPAPAPARPAQPQPPPAREPQAQPQRTEPPPRPEGSRPPSGSTAAPARPPAAAPARPPAAPSRPAQNRPPAPTAPAGFAPEAPPSPPPSAPGRAPTRPGPRPGPGRGPARPGQPGQPGPRPQRGRGPLRRLPITVRRPPAEAYGDDWPILDEATGIRGRIGGRVRWIVAAVAATVLATGGGAVAGALREPAPTDWLAATMPVAGAPILEAISVDAPPPSSGGLAAHLDGLLADPRLGARVTASVVDVATGRSIYDRDSTAVAIPASTAKLLTAAAVLSARGPGYRIPTRAVAGTTPGEVVLVGGGDPTLAAGETASYAGAARLDLLATQVRESLGGQAPTRVVVDTSLYSGPTYSPNWFVEDMNSGFIANITALMADGARRDPTRTTSGAGRYPQPDIAAGEQFAAALGVPPSAVSRGTAPAQSQPLGQVLSPPIGRIVELMLAESDNVLAEGLARQVAIARDQPASFDGAAAAMRAELDDLGLPLGGYVVVDGSGLAWANQASAALLSAVLAMAASDDRPELRPIVSGLPVAGYSGTLFERYLSPANGASAAGEVRAKTGTLTNVSSLAGLVVDADGRLLAFSVIGNEAGAGRLTTEAALDRVAAAIAGCGCS